MFPHHSWEWHGGFLEGWGEGVGQQTKPDPKLGYL